MPARADVRPLADRLELLDRLAAERGVALEHDVPIGPLTTLRVGGPADRVAVARSGAQLVAALELARAAGVPAGVIGKGSDIVVADAGVRGLVVRNRADGIVITGSSVHAESGAAMAALVKRCTAAGLAGIEFGISIPGSVGGAVWANAGAHGGEMKDTVVTVDAWSPAGGPRPLTNAESSFDYRESRYKHSGEIILSTVLALSPGDRGAIAARVAANQAQRGATQPLADQNAGSVFRNPSADHAGRLIDVAGLKGHRIGSAVVSTKHANFIVVDRGGSADDVRLLGDRVRTVVAERFGVTLAYEIEFVGEWGRDDRYATPTNRLAGS